jgi:hypothetical protein
MYRNATNHKQTASINPKTNEIIVMYDTGCDDILDYRLPCASKEDAELHLKACNFEEYDPNASLKAAGFVFSNGIYRKVGA